MAEFKQARQHAAIDGFANMGKFVPFHRRQAAYEAAQAMGVDDKDRALACVSGMAEQLERDKPYDAMEVGMRYVDLTGSYRLMSVLLTSPEPPQHVSAQDHQDVYGP